MNETLRTLQKNVEKAEKALQDYIKNNEFKTCTYEEFKKVGSVFRVASSIDSEFLDLFELMLGKDIWDMGYYKYETVYFTDICNRILDCDYEEDLKSLCTWFKTEYKEEAISQAVDVVMQWSLKTKSSGFKLDW